MMKLLWICLGGAIGTGARYLLSGWAVRLFGSSFPYGTLSVNAIGSFLIGVIMVIGVNTELISPAARVVLTVGVMGGFTTYSSFNYETLQYFQDGEWLLGLFNFGVMSLVCMGCGALGMMGTKWWIGS